MSIHGSWPYCVISGLVCHLWSVQYEGPTVGLSSQHSHMATTLGTSALNEIIKGL